MRTLRLLYADALRAMDGRSGRQAALLKATHKEPTKK